MKQLLHLILLTIVIFGFTANASANIFVITSDQDGNGLSDVWSISRATYNGSACEIKFIWEVPGSNTYPQFQYYASWPIWPPNGSAGCMNVPTTACGNRYSFDKVTSGTWMMDMGYTDFQHKQFVTSWLSGYSRACAPGVAIQDGESDLYARYQRNARIITRVNLFNATSSAPFPYDLVSDQTITKWLPVGSMQYHTPLNRESGNQFMVDVTHHGASWSQGSEQIIANGGPYGTVHEEITPTTSAVADNYIDYYYKTGAKFTITSNLPSPLALPVARGGHSATLLPNGKLLILGGGMVNNAVIDLSTDTWSDVSTTFNVMYHGASLLTNGSLLVTGGYVNNSDSSTVWLYDPATNAWSAAAAMSAARRAHTSVRLTNGKILIVGGIQGDSTVLKSAELYDPATNTWTPVADMPTPRYAAGAVLLPTGNVLVTGGSTVPGTALKSAILYDPVTDTWSATADMTTARYAPGITLLSDNSVLISGGLSGSTALTSMELFDYAGRTSAITADGWRSVSATMSAVRYHAASVLLPNGKALVTGGFTQGGAAQTSTELLAQNAEGVLQNRNADNSQLVPGYTPAPQSALFTGTTWLPATQTSLTASSVNATWESATWVPLGWTNGSGRIAGSGNSATATLGSNATSALKWNFEKHYITTIVADSAGMPVEIKAAFENQYDILGSGGASIKKATTVTNPSTITNTPYLTAAGASTIIVPERLTRTYNNIEENWVLEQPVLPAWATMEYDSVNQRYRITQNRQFLPWTYNFVYTKRLNVTIAVNGIDDADKALFKVLPGFSPSPSATAATFRLNETPNLSAPNTVFTNNNSIRYVLTGWTGGGSVADGNSSAGELTTATPTILANSTLTWNYKKQIRVATTTSGEDHPLKVYDLAGDTVANSTAVTNITVTNLAVGMAVTGYGIPDGTTIAAINSLSNALTLSATVTRTYGGTSGQRLTFTTTAAANSADPRECPSPAYDAATCAAYTGATRSNVHYYDASTISQQTSYNFTALLSFVDSVSGATRTLTQVLYSGGGSGNVQTSASGRRTLTSFGLDKPMSIEWRYDQTKAYTIGKPIFAPDGQNINTKDKPVITILSAAVSGDTTDSAFVWAWDNSIPSNQGMRYFPIHPVDSFTIKWPIANSSATYDETCMTIWPTWPQLQKHIAEAPANLQPPNAVNTFSAISYSTSGADATSAVFNAKSAGISVLRFTTPAVLPELIVGAAFVVVETKNLEPAKLDEIAWDIGAKITDAGHRDPENEISPSRNKSGYLYYDGGVYDGTGSDKAYDRSTRTGAIIPVNRSLPGDVKPLVVVWYERGQGDIGWPVTPKRYKADWPASPQTITISKGIAISPTARPQAKVYNQSDKTLAGFNPNEEHALLTGDTLYALRDDLNAIKDESRPYVLLKYFNTSAQEWAMEVYKVARPAGGFVYNVEAGSAITAPFPGSFQIPGDSGVKSGAGEQWHLRDHKGGHWAKAANWKTGDTINDTDKSSFTMQWYYYMRSDFYWPFSGSLAKIAGDVVPFMNNGSLGYYATGDAPADVTYVTRWPDEAPYLPIGDTLTNSRNGLPDLYNFKSAEVIFDESVYNGNAPLAKLYAPERYLYTSLAAIPSGVTTETGTNGERIFTSLPYAIKSRLFYDSTNKRLGFKGVWLANDGETPWLLPNLMTAAERAAIKGLSSASDWTSAVDVLYAKARNPNGVDDTSWANARANPYKPGDNSGAWKNGWGIRLGLGLDSGVVAAGRSIAGEKNALSAGMAQGEGYVVIAENDNSALAADAPVQLHVIRVAKNPLFRGVVKSIKATNLFDEKLTLHYTGDFGGEPEKFNFEWYYQPVSGAIPGLPSGTASADWQKFIVSGSDGYGLSDITISGASPLTMSDNWFAVRYYYKTAWPAIAVASTPANPATPHDDLNNWSDWSGANLTEPMLAVGWVKRVVDGLNPLEARVTDFRNSATNTTVSMLSQFGTRYEGPIALNSDAGNLNNLGLISAYETVLDRAREFSIDAVPAQNYGPTNDALLNISSRLATFYLALGNEAYADAVDPTIGFSTKSAEYGNMAPSVFAFQNQLDSLLEEELALMRGRDDSSASTRTAPYYNRLIWNFTQGEGEVAYAQNYNVTDQDGSGVINAADARIMYPQGHGDAWGHYLQAISYYYKLLGHASFSWEPRVEYVLVAGNPVMVDYLDERKFAGIAAARAKTGAEILDLTYRKYYTDDPAGQWQGYKDAVTTRAWGVDEWARRAGMAAYFDWVTANAILPDSVPATAHDRKKYVTDANGAIKEEIIPGAGIQQIDRTKVPELVTIASQFQRIQSKMDEVDNGINPLGLVKGVVPFDIDPSLIDSGQTHFEQIYTRAEKALTNAISAYDYANGYTQRLRQNQDTLEDFKKNLNDQERDYKNRLIEIFGYPYADDIGAGKTYPDGYDGPDLFHYNYVDRTELTGGKQPAAITYKTYTVNYTLPTNFWGLTTLEPYSTSENETKTISYNIDAQNFWQVKPTTWTLNRRAPGKIQQTLGGLIQAKAAYDKAYEEYRSQVGGIEDAKDNLAQRFQVLENQISVRNSVEGSVIGMDVVMNGLHATGIALKRASAIVNGIGDAAVETLPKDVTVWGGDVLSPARGTTKMATEVIATGLDVGGDITDMAEFSLATVKERLQSGMELNLAKSDASYEVSQLVKELQNSMSDLDLKLMELYSLKETIQQAAGNYQAALTEGLRLWDERTEKRAQAASNVQEYRYQDLGFRVFRNDAIQKYRAQFDLAAKYVYLAATAYDYETNLMGTASGAGRKFLSEIARQRALGVISNAIPQAGFPGLADVMARLSQNFSVYKTQLGFNNPQTETTPFSLRTELFRIKSDASSDADWRTILKEHKVADLWKIPEFKRYCRPFAPESAGAQPGIVIKFPTTITYGKNFFGWPLSGGDSAYSSSNFSTRVRSVGVWFKDYDTSGLSSTPRIYLVPTGADVLRSPTGDGFATREWQVQDQKLPAPFQIGNSELTSSSYIPVNDSLSDELAGIRRMSDFRAYPYGGAFNASQTTADSRLVGRSVWNTQWMLIIPGATLLSNKDTGLNTFINSVDDIRMFFQTYAYSGN